MDGKDSKQQAIVEKDNEKVIMKKGRFLYIIMTMVLTAVCICLSLNETCVKAEEKSLGDGKYNIEVSLEGGSGKASITSPAVMTVENGKAYLEVIWSSANYDYMIVDGEKYEPINEEGNSVFEIPVSVKDASRDVIADTVAMSVPHEVAYTITWDVNSITRQNKSGLSNVWVAPYGYVILFTILIVGLITFLLYKKRSSVVAAILILILFLTLGCSFYVIYRKEPIEEETREEMTIPDAIGSHLSWEHSLELEYAAGFCVDYYLDEKGDSYKLVTIDKKEQYLVVPDSGTVYSDIPENLVVLESPRQVYLVASQVMDMIASIDAMDVLQFSALDAGDWYLPEAKKSMENGSLLYAGKYSAPDYELILDKGCDLAIENTMIYHTPEVKEKLESFGIPVLVDCSSYEEEPLGRAEWVKLYGVLFNREEEAKLAFDEQVKAYMDVVDENSGKERPTVAFFYISANGDVKVRKSNDYMIKMIEAAGGTYIFPDMKGEGSSSTVNMQIEEFYGSAKDADYIIYNSTIEGELDRLDDLLKKSELMKDMKAVETGNVYCTTKNLYQSTMQLGTITSDIHKMLEGEADMNYLYKLN